MSLHLRLQRIARFFTILSSGLTLPLLAETEPLTLEPGEALEIPADDLFNLPPVVVFQTSLGDIPVELTPGTAPATVANFLRYAEGGLYQNSFFHRSALKQDNSPFVIQGGGYFFDLTGEQALVSEVPAYDPVVNEPNVSNLRGTIAMAKSGNDPNSATSQWFFNLADNATILDGQNGGFTVFGEVVGGGMTVVDAIAGLTRYNLIQQLGTPFNEVPLTDNVLNVSNFVTLTSIAFLAPEISNIVFPDGGASYFNINASDGIFRIEVSGDALPGDYRVQFEGTTLGGTSELAERTLQITPLVQPPWYETAVALGDGWRWFDWFKSFKPVGEDWVYHELHGWLYVPGDDPSAGLYLWDAGLNRWLWTSETLYPWLYVFGPEGGWVFFFENGSPGARVFARGESGEIITEHEF